MVIWLGKCYMFELVYKLIDLYGWDLYWIGLVGVVKDGGEGIDFYVMVNGYVFIMLL